LSNQIANDRQIPWLRIRTKGVVVASILVALDNIEITGKMRIFLASIILAIGCAPCIAYADKDKQADALMLALPASAYLLTWSSHDEDGAWALTRSLGLSALGTLALNSVIDKQSPNGKSDDAFPSGHSTIAFSAASFIQRRYGWKKGIPAYLVASYTGWLRVDTDDHDYADVIGGAAVGIISSYLFTKPFDDNVQASAWSDGKSAGLRIQVRW
jgi:membrane-associated phospholipid phosphatase